MFYFGAPMARLALKRHAGSSHKLGRAVALAAARKRVGPLSWTIGNAFVISFLQEFRNSQRAFMALWQARPRARAYARSLRGA